MATFAEAESMTAVEPVADVPFGRALARSWLLVAVLVVVGSTVVGGIFALSMLQEGMWRVSFAQWWAWGLTAPLIVMVDRMMPFNARQLRRRVWAHFGASMVITAIYMNVFYVFRAILHEQPWKALRPAHMFSVGNFGWFTWSLLVYWMIFGVLQANRYYDRFVSSELRLQRMEKSYTQARLNALRMQLDPHFLFNALNTISSHVERDPRLTRSMIEHLGDLLRMSLETKDRQEVPLAEELAFLEHYLEIQKIRFGDQLAVEIDVAPEVRYASVPCLFLQPLVENAIRHGISRRISGGVVRVTARAVGENLVLQVEDDGLGLAPGWTLETGSGLGLTVTRERIAGLYSGDHAFNIRRRHEGGTCVEILLPLRLQEEENGRG